MKIICGEELDKIVMKNNVEYNKHYDDLDEDSKETFQKIIGKSFSNKMTNFKEWSGRLTSQNLWLSNIIYKLENESNTIIFDIPSWIGIEQNIRLFDYLNNHHNTKNITVITNNQYFINNVDIKNLVIIDEGIKYNSKNCTKRLEEWKYTGLNNYDYLTCKFYKTGFE